MCVETHDDDQIPQTNQILLHKPIWHGNQGEQKQYSYRYNWCPSITVNGNHQDNASYYHYGIEVVVKHIYLCSLERISKVVERNRVKIEQYECE